MARNRRPADYQRRGPVREPYDTVLIVCEGTKTEPKYFAGLCTDLRLSNANIRVVPSGYGTDPMSVVRYAEEQANEYDRVFCVFDRNGHANYGDALQKARDSAPGKAKRLVAIPSVPCFEFWILLHYEYSTAPFNAVGKKSSCDRVIQQLEKHVPGYQKGNLTYGVVSSRTEAAIRHAAQLANHNANSGSENPRTDVHQLVNYLRTLRR